MRTLTVIKPFAFAVHGHTVVNFTEGETAEMVEECADIALREGWARPPRKRELREVAAEFDAPETK